jgi:DNA-directed RNA polymerase alpha subunit
MHSHGTFVVPPQELAPRIWRKMSDMYDVFPTDPIEPSENALRALENALEVKYREGYEKGQFDARNEMDNFTKNVFKSNTGQPSARQESILNTSIYDLSRAGELSVLTRNLLASNSVFTIKAMVEESAESLLEITNFGQVSLDEVHTMLGKRGLALKK